MRFLSRGLHRNDTFAVDPIIISRIMRTHTAPHAPLRRRITVSIFTVWFVLLGVGVAYPANASLPVIDAVQAKDIVEKQLAENVGFQLTTASFTVMQNILQQILADTAGWIASGGEGQMPLFDRKTALESWGDLALNNGLEFLSALDSPAIPISDAIGGHGGDWLGISDFNGFQQFLCAPNPQIALQLKLGLADRLRPKPPRCTWQQIKDGFTRVGSEQNIQQQLSGIGASFEPGQSDLAVGLDMQASLTGALSKTKQEFDKMTRDSGYLGPQETIAEWTKTPASVVAEETAEHYVGLPTKMAESVGEWAAEDIRSTDYFLPMLLQMGKNLTLQTAQSLVIKLIQKQVLEKGIFLSDIFDPDDSVLDGFAFDSSPSVGRATRAVQAFAPLKEATFNIQGSFDILGTFSTCPDPSHRTLDTCVLDTDFSVAVRNGMTVRQALDAQGGLHGERKLVPAGAQEEQSNATECLTSAYCASNLEKLRLWRIIPIGWELAANHPANTSPYETLDRVVEAFDETGPDGRCGTPDDTSSYCGLIDPDWVLKYPEHECRLTAPTEVLQTSELAYRAETCRDPRSCVRRNDDGSCAQFGYCAAEQQVWRLNGESCPSYAASCQRFTGSSGAELAVLTNTVEHGVCDAGNAGCLWYAAEPVRNTNAWNAAGERRYFNANAQTCVDGDEGCTELIAVEDLHANLIPNPSFEEDDDGNGVPDGWELGSSTTTNTEPSHGAVAIEPDYEEGVTLAQDLVVFGGQTYTLSAYAKYVSGGDGAQLSAYMKIYDEMYNEVRVAGIHATCNATNAGITNVNLIYLTGFPTVNGGYERFSCTWTMPAAARWLTLELLGLNGTVLADAIQLELGDTATAFNEGDMSGAPRTHLRAAPDAYQCYDMTPGGALVTDNDDARCTNFASACTPADVGCEAYTPIASGYDIVNGTVTIQDQCFPQCVGYDAYREVESTFDVRNAFDYFIPESATKCTAADVGCSAFTNLDAAAAGGESRAYFTDLRICRKPSDADASPATYYTWEGSEAEGYQIREFRLKSSTTDTNSAPFTFGGSSSCQTQYDKEPGDAGYDAEITPDCRAFYSQNGTINYRRLSKTIVIADSCTRYRLGHELPVVGNALPAGGTEDQQAICTRKGGTWDASAGCTFQGVPEQSGQCRAEVAGCRAYRGNTSGAASRVLVTSFEAGLDGWTGGASIQQVSEAVVAGAHSLRVTGTTGRDLNTTLTNTTTEVCTSLGGTLVGTTCTAPQLQSGTAYELTFTARGTGRVNVSIVSGTTLLDEEPPAVTIGTTWRQYTVGPLLVRAGTTPPSTAELLLAVTDGTVYIDELTLRSAPQQTYVVKRSWQTPAACDLASIESGAAVEAQGMLGCREYRDRDKQPHYIRSFSRLCDAVGCTAFYDTKNSDAIESVVYNGTTGSTLDTVTAPADTIRYLVDAPAFRCKESSASCTRFGKPTLDRSGANPPEGTATATGWSDVFYLDDPDQYTGASATMCTHEALFCEAFRGSGGQTAYFKNPGDDRTCEYRKDPVTLPSGSVMKGWFQKGTDEPCYANLVESGNTFAIRRNSDSAYAGWVGTCAPEDDQCVELVDPADTSNKYPDGRPYNVLRNTIDLSGCSGAVDQKAGCVLLKEEQRTAKTWSAAASYAAAEESPTERSAPIDCDRNPSACKRCVQQKHCETLDGRFVQNDTGGNTCAEKTDCDSTDNAICVDGGVVREACMNTPQCQALHDQSFTCNQLSNDANLLVAARADRQCIQWYEPAGEFETVQNGNKVLINTNVSLVGEQGGELRRPAPSYLTTQTYQQRDRTYAGIEYSGYAIPLRPGLEFLRQLKKTADEFVLVPVYCAVGDPGCSDTTAGHCVDTAAEGAACGPLSLLTGSARGVCVKSLCTWPPAVTEQLDASGTAIELAYTTPDPLERTCRAYPERDAPYPATENRGVFSVGRSRITSIDPDYREANVCDADEDKTCECSYTKVRYAGGNTRYYEPTAILGTDYPAAICIGGQYDGEECDVAASGARISPPSPSENLSCNTSEPPDINDGVCRAVEIATPLLGLPGQCLEWDESIVLYGEEGVHPCKTFYPVGQLVGVPGVGLSQQSAAYTNQNQYMCLRARGNLGPTRSPSAAYYPALDPSRYLVAARIEGEYTNPTFVVEEGASIFSNDFTGADVSKWMRWPYTANPVHGSVQRVPGTNSFNDRITGKAESSYWYPNQSGTSYGSPRFVYEWEVDSIVLVNDMTATNADANDFNPGTITLRQSSDWIACAQRDRHDSSPVPKVFNGKKQSRATVAAGGWDTKGGVWCWDKSDYGSGRHRFDGSVITAPTAIAFCDTEQTSGVEITFTDASAQSSPAPADKQYLGVRVVWDPATRRLMSIDTGYCNDADPASGSETRNTPYNIFFRFREWCTNVAQVSGSPDSKPWTDRTWALSSYGLSHLGYTQQTATIPFGRADTAIAPATSPWFIDGQATTLVGDPPNRPTTSDTFAGTPYSCEGLCSVSTAATATAASTAQSLTDARAELQEVFASVVQQWQWTSFANGYFTLLDAAGDPPRDISGDASAPAHRSHVPTAPVVYGVGDPSTLDDDNPPPLNPAYKDTMTINGTSLAEDANGDALAPVVLAHGQRTDIYFYMQANADQMPIRSVNFDWGENGRQALTIDNSTIPNHLPECDGATFGTSSAAGCTKGAVHLINSYTCEGEAGLTRCDGAWNDANASISPAGCWDADYPRVDGGSGACIYQPRIKITDNWGYCNGSCPGNGGGNLCFDASGVSGANECVDISLNSWTPFANRIVVTPQE
ncbi:MAG: hypothetical protein Q7S96_02795 [bacterium]|nr:hypothetical protein [bacterium]